MPDPNPPSASSPSAASSTSAARLAEVLVPVLAELGTVLYDVELVGSGRARTLRVLVDREGGVDLATVTAATEAVGPVLDDDPVVASLLPAAYLLEVSSPGLERPLRTAAHFRAALGCPVSLKATTDGATRRDRVLLVAADDDGIEVEREGTRERIEYGDIVQARTVFEWGPAPKPGQPKAKAKPKHAGAARTGRDETSGPAPKPPVTTPS